MLLSIMGTDFFKQEAASVGSICKGIMIQERLKIVFPWLSRKSSNFFKIIVPKL